MLRHTFLLILTLSVFSSATAQTLYMPRDVARAFEKGTRSPDGQPGPNYWQNHGRYDMTITATPPDRTIQGAETITYFNNSPDTLKTLVIKLFQNVHKPGAARLSQADPDYLTEGVHIDAFAVNGQEQEWKDNPFTSTWKEVKLPAPLLPHDSVQLSFDWHYQVSLRSGREGMIDSTTFFLAYFYPRVAVYDDYAGWDRMTFNDSQEFYNDFNNYTVTVNVPANYLVVGTGTLQRPETLLQAAFAERFETSLTSDTTVRIVKAGELAAKNITTQNATNSWQFKATHIPDMAFGLSDHFVWDAGSVVVDDATGRRASVQALYNDTAADYHSMVAYARDALDWFSRNWPGVPYPYEKSTIFQGYAGMEYPMMANDESYQDTVFSRLVAEHEIAHTYMPFYMGINETRFGFMDEGWATTFELLKGRENLGREKADEFYRNFRINRWANDQSAVRDVPIMTPGHIMSGIILRDNQYGKPSLGYLAVKDLLGDTLFKKCLHAYMERWNGKHPIPWDFFNTFNDVSGKNLNWFWNNWFFSRHHIDLAVRSLAANDQGYTLTIDNIGGMAAPVDIRISYTDGTRETLHQTPIVWQSNQKQAHVPIPTKKKIQSLTLDGGIFVDPDTTNNGWSADTHSDE